MVFPNRKIVENIRREYPVGTRVELIRMHDKQAPPVGMTGTVLGVDDTASLLMHWDNGSGLNVIYGEDCVKKDTHSQNCLLWKDRGVVFEGESRRIFLSGNFGK